MNDLPPLSTLLAFEAVARRRSFTLAAGELNLTASAISHQISKLETLVGTKLLERTTAGVKLSNAGEYYLQRVGAAMGVLKSATRDVREGVRNSLYVHASPSFASLWLMPRLSDFASSHPDVSLFLSASPTHSDFTVGQSDLDIRYGVPRWPNLVVKPLFSELVLPLASSEFLQRFPIHIPSDLLQAPLIQSTVSVVQWSDWLMTQQVQEKPERYALRFDRAQLSLDAAVQGLGVALESGTMAAGHLKAGRLRSVFDLSSATTIQGHFAVYPERHRKRPEVAQFLDWLELQAANM